MPREPKPGMGQKEKDQLGLAAHQARQEEVARQTAETAMRAWTPDANLEAMDEAGLRAEADLRGVQLPKTISDADARKRLTARRAEVTEDPAKLTPREES
jgi:hypothetical protein